jgi:hypothetical protein
LALVAAVLQAAAEADLSWRVAWNALPVPVTWGLLCAGWLGLRLVGGDVPWQPARVAVVAVVFTIVAVPVTLMAAALVRPETVRLCVTGYTQPMTAGLIAVTKERAVVTSNDGAQTRQRIVRLPGDAITRADTGEISGAPPCPAAPKTDSG